MHTPPDTQLQPFRLCPPRLFFCQAAVVQLLGDDRPHPSQGSRLHSCWQSSDLSSATRIMHCSSLQLKKGAGRSLPHQHHLGELQSSIINLQRFLQTKTCRNPHISTYRGKKGEELRKATFHCGPPSLSVPISQI